MLEERDTTRGNVLRIDRDGRISKVTEAQNMTTYSEQNQRIDSAL